MDEAERLADRVAILDHGRVLEAGTPAKLKAGLGGEVVRLRIAKGRDAFAKALQGADGVRGVQWKDDEAHVRVASADAALPGLLDLAHRSGARLAALEVHRATLEDVFIARTGKALRDQP
jgi:ABC-2 type transport system ATP-binding protein